MESTEYFQYIRKCVTKQQEIGYFKLISKLRKKFHLSDEEATNLLTELKNNNLIFQTGDLIEINILANPIRRNIYNLIQQYPGLFVNYIRRKLNIGPNHVLYHLSELENLNMISFHTFGNIKAFSLPDVSEQEVKIGIFLLRNNIKDVISIMLTNDRNTSESQLIERSSIPRSTLIYVLNKLIKEKLVKKTRSGNEKMYSINPKFETVVQNAFNSLGMISS